MFFFGRLRCHFCDAGSAYSKGTTEFQCANCEAYNFFDKSGNVVDTPASVIARPPRPPRKTAASKPVEKFIPPPIPDAPGTEADLAFCAICLNNQRMYTEALSSYLPDEDHPRYQEFEDTLPQYKRDLEKRYPQICRACAPKVQMRMHKADYFAMLQNAGKNMRNTQQRGVRAYVGKRDDWGKRSMRLVLGLIRLFVYASLLAQAMWHSYGILGVMFSSATAERTDDTDSLLGTSDFAFDPTFKDCARQSWMLRFDSTCYRLFSTLMPGALLVHLILIWYNPGLRHWWHHTHRMEAISGQKEYFSMQLFLLILRVVAWTKLSDPAVTDNLTASQLLAAHGFMAFFMLLVQLLSEQLIEQKIWKISGRITPKPEIEDVYGPMAGPATKAYTAQASSNPPAKLFARHNTPFPIQNLAPQRRGYSKLNPTQYIPSPPESQSDDEDAMDIDDAPPYQQSFATATSMSRTFQPTRYQEQKTRQTRSTWNYGNSQPEGWSHMRNEMERLQAQHQAEAESRKRASEAKLRYEPPVEQSPFRGRLPQAPMSQERKLRNPPTQVSFKKQPDHEQQDFMKRMRDSFDHANTFATKKTELRNDNPQTTDDEDMSPAKTRTKGSLDLYDSGWRLPGDGVATTGLEDLFGGNSFSISQEPHGDPAQRQHGPIGISWVWAAFVPIAVAIVGWNVPFVRRPACLWMASKLEELGY